MSPPTLIHHRHHRQQTRANIPTTVHTVSTRVTITVARIQATVAEEASAVEVAGAADPGTPALTAPGPA